MLSLFFWNLSFFFHTFFGTYLLLQILSYWNHPTIKMFSFFRTWWHLFFLFLPFILLEIFSFFCQILPIHPYRDFFKFHSAITSAYVQLFKPFKYLDVQLFQLFQPSSFQPFNFSNFFSYSAFSKNNLALNQMGKASNPLKNSSTFNLILFIHWARDTIQTLKQSWRPWTIGDVFSF